MSRRGRGWVRRGWGGEEAKSRVKAVSSKVGGVLPQTVGAASQVRGFILQTKGFASQASRNTSVAGGGGGGGGGEVKDDKHRAYSNRPVTAQKEIQKVT